MDYKDITVGIVTFKSKKVLFKCLKSIKKIQKIIIYDNSNDFELKNEVKIFYPKVKFILSKMNLGYGVANNKIISNCKTKYLFIINPDTVLKKNCENELLKSINLRGINFSILAPISQNKNYGFNKNNKKFFKNNLIETNYVKGFAMIINTKEIRKIGMFDKNIFLYLEEIDLCRRIQLNNQKIYINKKAKIFHSGAKSSDLGFEFERCRNWHWMWSRVYYDKKYKNYLNAIFKYLPVLLITIIRIFLFSLLGEKKKVIIFYMRFSGLFNALIGRKSWFRPKFSE